jgi:cytochrome c-type biogenesis protein CcmH/NrfG
MHARKALELQPGKIDTGNMLGTMLFQQGDVNGALMEWRKVLSMQPDSYAQNSLAWVLATSADPSIRNGEKAVELAQQASSLSGDNASVLRTLAAAYAENGQFSDAIETAERAVSLAVSKGDLQLAEDLRREISLYRERLPLRAGRP